MATLLETLGSLATPDNVGMIGNALGVDTSLVQQGLKAVGPTVLGSLSKTSSTPDGAASLMKMLPTDAVSTGGSPADLLGNVMSSLSGGGTSADMMNNVLCGGVNAISGTLSKSLGFDVGPLLKMGVPVVMGLLAKSAKDKKLDANGVSKMLKDESTAFMNDPANKQVSDLAQSALKAGDQAAALRKTYTDAEWTKVRGAPLAAMYLVATAIIPQQVVDEFPSLVERLRAFVAKHPELVANIHPIGRPGVNGRRLLAVVNEDKLRRILARMLDENRFLSSYGIRSLSRWHLEHPYEINVGGAEYNVQYLPAESDTGMFGGNSNWRGPIWMPVNLLMLRALVQFHQYFGDESKVECPTGSGNYMTLFEVAREIATRLTRIFLRDPSPFDSAQGGSGQAGKRPVYGGAEKSQTDPHWRDYILFYEYFHGDNGAGLGASHQTGWTGTVARLLQQLGTLQPDEVLAHGLGVLAKNYQRS